MLDDMTLQLLYFLLSVFFLLLTILVYKELIEMKLCIWWWLKQSMLTDAFGPRLESFKYVTVGDSNWIPFFKRWALSNSFVLESSIILTNSRCWNSFSFWSLYYSSLCLDVEKVNPSGVVCMCWLTEYRLEGLHLLYLVVAGSKLVFIEILKKSSQLLEEKFSSPPIKFQVAFKFDLVPWFWVMIWLS